jgi:hypothetical protein
MTQIAVRDDLLEKAMRLTEGKYPVEQLAEFAFRGYTDVLSLKELEGKFHWDDDEDWSKDEKGAQ